MNEHAQESRVGFWSGSAYCVVSMLNVGVLVAKCMVQIASLHPMQVPSAIL